eukprot:TRINITY_DN381_c0_g1_i1.p1 TRINITY_DN381_c0_g1~~TRINITY_DN381_c0_g1_i1.p1  ORF type:complete len:769 (-),score=306.56 TRINITY_DN381_c0_g1_i1:325-2631(-)
MPPATRCIVESNCNGGPLFPTPTTTTTTPTTSPTPAPTPTPSPTPAPSPASASSLSRANQKIFTTQSVRHSSLILRLNPMHLADATAAPVNDSVCQQLLSSTSFSRDPTTLYCLVKAGGDNQCPPGNTGPVCDVCIAGWHKGTSGNCEVCPSVGGSWVYLVFVGVGTLLVFALLLYIVMKWSRGLMKEAKKRDAEMARIETADILTQEDMLDMFRLKSDDSKSLLNSDGTRVVPPDFTFKAKIVLGFLQIGVSITSRVIVAWPRLFRRFLSWFSLANLDFIRIISAECVFTFNYYANVVFVSASPLILAGLVAVFYLLPKRLGFCSRTKQEARENDIQDDETERRKKLADKRSRRRFWRVTLFLLFLIYPTVSSTILKFYDCRDYYGRRLMDADKTVDCDSSDWRNYAVYGAFMILVYPIGIPLFFLYKIWQYRYPKDGGPSRLSDPDVRAQLGFLYSDYHDQLWWFEMVDMLNKLVMTSCIVFFPTSLQLAAGMAVIMLYSMIILIVNPYIRKGDDRLHLFANIELFLMLFITYSFQEQIDLDDSQDTLVSVILIIISAGFFLFFLVQSINVLKKLIPELWNDCRKGRIDEEDDEDDIALPTSKQTAKIDSQGVEMGAISSNPLAGMSANPLARGAAPAKPAIDDEELAGDPLDDEDVVLNANPAYNGPAPISRVPSVDPEGKERKGDEESLSQTVLRLSMLYTRPGLLGQMKLKQAEPAVREDGSKRDSPQERVEVLATPPQVLHQNQHEPIKVVKEFAPLPIRRK